MLEKDYPFFTALIAEYTALKNEQTQRIVLRDTSFYISISANTAIAAVYSQYSAPLSKILLLIPFASTLLFWLYATNDAMVTQIRRYIMSNIAPELTVLKENRNVDLLGWDSSRRRKTISRVASKLFRLLAVWFTFSGGSLIALWATAPDLHVLVTLQNLPWMTAALFTGFPYLFGLWLIDL